jgi:hypothetical protein
LSGFIRTKSNPSMNDFRIESCFRSAGPPPPGEVVTTNVPSGLLHVNE